VTFVSPDRLWLLAAVPVLIALYVIMLRRRKSTGMRFTNTTLLSRVMPKQSQWRRHFTVALALASLAVLAVAWARPNGIEYVARERATVVLVIDVSQSMAATDVAPNRLDAAKQAAIAFIKELPDQYNVSVVSLSGNPSVVLPPTTDRTQTQQAVNSLKLKDSTAIGESIYTAVDALKQAPLGEGETIPPGAIVLLSDGQNTAGRSPVQAATEAGKLGVPVYTIAYGTDNGYVDLDGKREVVAPDRDLLKELASVSKGSSFDAESLNELNKVYANIGSEVGQVPVEKEVSATWAGYGLVLAAVAALGAISLGVRWP
jgi:Ca-activated chloride channel family protein